MSTGPHLMKNRKIVLFWCLSLSCFLDCYTLFNHSIDHLMVVLNNENSLFLLLNEVWMSYSLLGKLTSSYSSFSELLFPQQNRQALCLWDDWTMGNFIDPVWVFVNLFMKVFYKAVDVETHIENNVFGPLLKEW